MKTVKMKTFIITISAVIAIAAALCITVYSAGTYGTQSDPLITKSYLDEVFQPAINSRVDTAITDAANALRAELNAVYTVKTIAAGQTYTLAAGGEILLRSGTLTVTAGSLIDTTGGNTLAANGSLSVNHLYFAADSVTVKATADALVLTRG